MSFIDRKSKVSQVYGFQKNQMDSMYAYVKGAVYSWCKNCKNNDGTNRWFAARDLFGGENYYWEDTPLMPLYEYYHNRRPNDNEYAVQQAGRAVGRILQRVLIEDKREYERRNGYTWMYRWTGEEL